MSYEAVYFCSEIGVVASSTAFGDVVLVCVQYDVEISDVFVEVFDGCVVQSAKMLFSFLGKLNPVCSFVVCESAVWVIGFRVGFELR